MRQRLTKPEDDLALKRLRWSGRIAMTDRSVATWGILLSVLRETRAARSHLRCFENDALCRRP